MDWTKEEKQMGETVIEKIIRNNVGHAVKPGDIVTVNVDRVMIHDIFIPFVAEKFEEMGFQKLWDPDKVVLIYDHLVPASQLDDTRHFHEGDAFAEKYGMKNVHPAIWYSILIMVLPCAVTRCWRKCMRLVC